MWPDTDRTISADTAHVVRCTVRSLRSLHPSVGVPAVIEHAADSYARIIADTLLAGAKVDPQDLDRYWAAKAWAHGIRIGRIPEVFK